MKYKAKELFQTPFTMLRKLLDSSKLKIVYNELCLKGSSVELIKALEEEFLLEEGNILFKEEFDTFSSKGRLIAINIAKGCHTPKAIASAVGDNISNVK